MKIAIVHDWFDQVFGGSEQVAIHIAELFPDADIFTLLYDKENFDKKLGMRNITVSNLQKLPARIRKNHKLLLPLIPGALNKFDFTGYDLVISSSPAFSKNITTPEDVPHLTYCHSPMRFAWDYWPRYLNEQKYGLIQTALAKVTIPRIRKWDYKGAQNIDRWLANSITVKNRIKKYYNIDKVEVLHPPVDFTDKPKMIEKHDEYYVTLATLTQYKQIDLAIKACNRSRRKLIVIGDGPMRTELEGIAGETITFTGFINGEEKWNILRKAHGLIFPTIEDFGMAPIEAMAVGTPVIAFKKGGVTETVEDHVSGVFFDEQTSESIAEALDIAESIEFDHKKIAESAKKYDSSNFDKRFLQIVEEML